MIVDRMLLYGGFKYGVVSQVTKDSDSETWTSKGW